MTKSSISFGLVNIPINMERIIKNNDTSFKELHKKCLERIKHIKYCPNCKKTLKEVDVIKGYEFERENYLIFSKEELKKLKPINEKQIEVVAFIKENEVPLWYYEKSYNLFPEGKSKAYDLFYEALKKTKMMALVKTIIGTKFYYAIIKPTQNGLIMITIYFKEEINKEEYKINSKLTIKEIDLAIKLIKSLTLKFDDIRYTDEYTDKINKAIDLKLKGKKIPRENPKSKKEVGDLLKALEESLKNGI